MEPIARYSYCRWFWKVTVSLFPEEIVIESSRWLVGSSRTATPLHSIDPKPDHGWVRPAGFVEGLALFLISSALGAFWLFTQGFPPEEHGPFACGIFAAIGLTSAAWNFRRWEFVEFKSDQGTPLFCLWCSPRGRTAFAPFLEAVIQQLKTIRNRQTR